MDKIFQKGRMKSRLTDEGNLSENELANINDMEEYVKKYGKDSAETEFAIKILDKNEAVKFMKANPTGELEDGAKNYVIDDPSLLKTSKIFVLPIGPADKANLKALRKAGIREGKLTEATVNMNDPFLVQTRIMRHAAKERKALDAILKAQPKVRQYKISFDKYLELLDQQMFFQQDLADIGKQLKQMWIDMEQEAEPEGGPIADRYGRDLMKLEADYKKVKAKLAKVDARVDRHSRY